MDYYRITPMIVPADKVSEIRIEPLFDHAVFPADPQRIEIQFFPWNGLLDDGRHISYDFLRFMPEELKIDWHFDGQAIVFRKLFPDEQEYNILISIKDETGNVKKRCRFHLYSLKPDLYALRPFRGTFHIHTTGSDGAEECRYTAARYRQLGMDFCAITDHRNYAPSVTAMNFWKEFIPDYKLFPGEEVHPPANYVHVVNFGGKSSVNQLSWSDEEKYRREVAGYLKNISTDLSPEDRFAAAATEWVFDRIRQAGGVAIFCHPYWFTEQYVLDSRLTDEIFRRNRFDAFELLGGFHKHQTLSNNHQLIRYFEEQAKGNRFPVVGCSDSHCTDRFEVAENKVASTNGPLAGWYSTLVFAKSDDFEDIADAIRCGRSAAVEKIEGETPKVWASLRLAQYGSFLLRWYYPMHDVLCADEGALMLRILYGDPNAAAALRSLHGSVANYQKTAFASGC